MPESCFIVHYYYLRMYLKASSALQLSFSDVYLQRKYIMKRQLQRLHAFQMAHIPVVARTRHEGVTCT
jgi:hypothetical protein